jgi:hypothetical protein
VTRHLPPNGISAQVSCHDLEDIRLVALQ